MVNTGMGAIYYSLHMLEMVIIKVPHKILLKITLKTVATWNLFSYKAACRKQKQMLPIQCFKLCNFRYKRN